MMLMIFCLIAVTRAPDLAHARALPLTRTSPIDASARTTAAGPRGDVIALSANELHAWMAEPDAGERRALVEFYMPWCGHCQHFAPEYARVAETLRGSDVRAYAVDCVVHGRICKEFALTGYPSVLLGTKRDFGSRDVKAITKFTGHHTAGDVVKWVDSELGTAFASGGVGAELVKEAVRGDERVMIASSSAAAGTFARAHAADIERATIEMYAQMTSEAVLTTNSDAREAFLDFITLAAAAHPIDACHRGLTAVVGAFDAAWPLDGSRSTNEIRAALTRDVRVCGNARGDDATVVPQWVECAGSVPGLRGYTCGVWTTLHALAARAPTSPGVTNASFIRAVKGWVRHFFPCEECRAHFLSMLSARETSFDDYSARADGASMWMWRAHNIVNARLAKEVAEDVANASVATTAHDPKFPKVQFPTKSTCSRCYARAETGGEDVWDEIRVSEFLHMYYLADGARRDIDLQAPTTVSEMLAPMIVASRNRDARAMGADAAEPSKPSARRSKLGDVSVYDVFFMSARFFVMFAVIIFMCIQAGVMKLSHGNGKRLSSSKFPTMPISSRDVEDFKAA